MLRDTYNAQKNASSIYLGLVVTNTDLSPLVTCVVTNTDLSPLVTCVVSTDLSPLVTCVVTNTDLSPLVPYEANYVICT